MSAIDDDGLLLNCFTPIDQGLEKPLIHYKEKL